MFKKKLLFATPLVVALPAVAISCGTTINSQARNEQEELFKKNAKTVVEQLKVNLLLNQVYSAKDATEKFDYKKEFNNQTSAFFNDAYTAFKVYAELNILKDSNFFIAKEAEWAKANAIEKPEQLLISDRGIPSKDRFVQYYNSSKTGIQSIINKMLITRKYFFENDKNKLIKGNEIKKIDFAFDINQYNLINYVLTNKTVQKWEVIGSNNDFLAYGSSTINNWKTYNRIVKETNYFSKTISEKLSLGITNGSDGFSDSLLHGYAGVVNGQFNGFGTLSDEYKVENIKKHTELVKRGFYDDNTKQLVAYDKLNEKPIQPWKTGKDKMSMSYFNLVLPTFVEAKTTDKGYDEIIKSDPNYKGYVSFISSEYQPEKLDSLIYQIAATDANIYPEKVDKYYSLNGFNLVISNELIKDALNAK